VERYVDRVVAPRRRSPAHIENAPRMEGEYAKPS
jgi:hypothetical protein